MSSSEVDQPSGGPEEGGSGKGQPKAYGDAGRRADDAAYPKPASERADAEELKSGGLSPSRLFILRPIATSLLMIALFLTGVVGFQFLPLSALPEVDYPTIQVQTFYPGASPEVMATNVTAPLERQFGQMQGLSRMSSNSSGGASIITLQFGLDLTLDVAEQEVQAAMNAAGNLLPSDLPAPPIYAKVNPADAPVMTIALSSATIPLTQVEDVADSRMAQKISQINGVGLVSVSGGQRPAVRIQANPLALTAYGLTLETLRTAISNANVNGAKGQFDGPSRSYTVNANDQLAKAEDYGNLVVAYRGGGAVRLKDVATIINGAENSQLGALKGSTPAVILNVQRQPGANVIGTVDNIKKLLPQLQETLPAGIDVQVMTDRTVTIRASVFDVEVELTLSILLVVLVIFVFLRNVRATIIAGIAVPLSLVGAFGAMYLFKFSLNNLTLMAMTIATGFVVDDAIVMIENISRHVEEGQEPRPAALKGSGEIGFTIISLTVSLLAVLIPLLFMADVVGRLFREFAITLAVTIVISAIVSLTLVPTLCGLFLRRPKEPKPGSFSERSEKAIDWVIDRYDVGLTWVLAHQGLTLIVAIGTFVLTALLYVAIPKGLFPVQDTGEIQGVVQAAQTISYGAMTKLQRDVADVISKDDAVSTVSSFSGVDAQNATLNTGRVLIELKPENKRVGASEVIRRLQREVSQIPGVQLYLQPVQDLTIDAVVGRTQYSFALESTSADELATWSARIVDEMRKDKRFEDVSADVANQGLSAYINVDRDTAGRLGVSLASIDAALYDAFGQRQVSTIFTQSNQYRVILESSPDIQKSPDALDSIYLQSSTGAAVPLTSIASIKIQPAPLQVSHVGQFPAATISFNLANGVALGNAVELIQKLEKDQNVPKSITTTFSGAAAAFQSSLSNELWLILAAVVTIYIVLGVLYESFIHPLTILSTLPSAAVGALLALMLFGKDLGVVGIIGIILLIGIVNKNAIMMIDFALDAERNEGLPPQEAIHQAALLRFRPILMTTMAALLGALPLMLGSGVGSELRQPLGISIVGGLIASQLLTLFTTPVIYLAFDGLARRFSRRDPEGPVRDEPEDPGPKGPQDVPGRLHSHGSPPHVSPEGERRVNPSALFIKRPVATILLTLGIALVGIASYFALPVASLPAVDFPVVFCQAIYPGASPNVMATSVATPLERHLGQIADVNELTSTSSLNRTQVVMQFNLGRDINGAFRDAQAASQAARVDLPSGLRSNPTCQKANPAAQPIIILNLTSDTLSMAQVDDAASLVMQQKLSQIEGVGQVDVQGFGAPAVRIEINPLALSKYGIALEDLRAAIFGANASNPKGHYSANGQRYQIYVNDQTFKAADYQGLIIAVRNGNPVRLSDVATVRDGGENEKLLGLFNGKPAITVQIRATPNANIVATVDRIKAALPQLREQISEISPQINVNVSVDRTQSIRASLADVERTLLIAIVLVVLVVLLFLRNGKATLIPGVAVTVSLLGTLAVMFMLKFSLDNLSLMALTVATGFVVDDAIVVLENITRHVEEGTPRFQAALQGSAEVGFTVVSMSISLIAVFIPILLMGGIVGLLFREFGMTLSAAIVISLVVSLTTTPMMAARLVDERSTGDDPAAERKGGFSRFWNWISGRLESGFNWMAETYAGSLQWALDHKLIVVLSLMATVCFNVYLYVIVPKGFFPQQDTGQLRGGIQVDQASSYLSTRAKFIKLVDIVDHDPAVDTVTAFSGGAGGFVNVQLKPRSERPGVNSDDVIARIRTKTLGISGAQLFLQSSQDIGGGGGRQSNAQYQYTLQSDDIDLLHTWSDKLTAQLKKHPELQDINTDQAEHGLETYITIDRDKASRLGLTAQAIDNVLNDAFAQRQVATIYNALNQYKVVMTVAAPYSQSPSALDNVYVSPGQGTVFSTAASPTGSAADPSRTPSGVLTANTAVRQGSTTPAGLVAVAAGAARNSQTAIVASPAGPRQQVAALATIDTTNLVLLAGAGTQRSTTGNANQIQSGAAVSTTPSRMIPLSAFATYAPGSTAVSINHQSGAVATTISFNAGQGVTLSSIQQVVKQAEEEISMPNTVRGVFAGSAQQFTDTQKSQPLLILSALLAVYIVLGVLYESYIHPITVLSTLPSAGVGALLALMFFHVEFDIMGLIGVILLIGIVKKNAILIIDFALTAERDQGLSPYDAIYQASMLRFRPILMTTMAAILGAVPLAVGFGEGGELRRPLGIAIVGGLIASQVLTLLTTPVVYLYMDKLRRRGKRRGDKPLPEGGRGTVGSPDPALVPRGTGQPHPYGAA